MLDLSKSRLITKRNKMVAPKDSKRITEFIARKYCTYSLSNNNSFPKVYILFKLLP